MTKSKGPVMFLVSSFLFAVMGVFVKLAAPYASVYEIAFFRFLTGIIVVLIFAKIGKISLVTKNKSLLVARGVFGGLAILLFYAAIKTGTLTNATVLNNTYPIFATMIAAVYLKERISRFVILPLMASVLGIVLLTQPNFAAFRSGDFFALASAVFAGVSVVTIRKLRKTETAWVVFFYMSIIGAGFSGLMAFKDFVVPSWTGAAYMCLVAFFGTVGQVINTSAYKYCTASLGSILSMMTAVFASFFGIVLLGESLSIIEAVGAVTVLASSAYIAYSGTEAQKLEEKTYCHQSKDVS